MTLLRAGARTLLASYFIAAGVKSVRHPDPLVPAAEPITDKVVPLVKQYAPDQISSFIPEDAKTLVRVNGALQVIGGLALASGRGRRIGSLLLAGSLIPSTLAKYPFWSLSDPDEKAAARSHFLKNISILGGVLLAAGDTEGKPSIAWRAQKGGHQIAKSTGKATDRLAKRASSLTDNLTDNGSDLSDFRDSALAGGAALVGTVVASTRKARKAAAKQAAVAQKAAAAAAKQAKKDAPKHLKAAKKFAAEQAETAKKVAAEQAETAKKVAAEQAEAARKAAKQAKKDAPKQLKAAKKDAAAARKDAAKRAKKVSKNIELGAN